MLSEDQVQQVRQVLMLPGWTQVMSPAIINRGRAALKALILAPEQRKQEGGEFKNTDDVLLRAIIQDAEWMAACWQNEIAIHEHNRRLDEQHNGADPQPQAGGPG